MEDVLTCHIWLDNKESAASSPSSSTFDFGVEWFAFVLTRVDKLFWGIPTMFSGCPCGLPDKRPIIQMKTNMLQQ